MAPNEKVLNKSLEVLHYVLDETCPSHLKTVLMSFVKMLLAKP